MKIINLTKEIEEYGWDKLMFKTAVRRQRGKHCFVYPYEKGKLLKIFHSRLLKDFSNPDILWGDYKGKDQPNTSVRLFEATKIQNICWMYGYAPRVYEIIGVEIGKKKYVAQIVEDVGDNLMTEHSESEYMYDKVVELGKLYGWKNEKRDVSKWDVAKTDDGDKLVDFNTFHFTPKHDERVQEKWRFLARYGKKYYQNVPEWNFTGGPRKTDERVEWMKLDNISFKDKTILDLGCSGSAFFCRYAKDRGGEVSGVDCENKGGPDPVMAAQLLCNEFGYWDIDFYESDLTSWNYEKGIYLEADIVFFLSLNYHIGIPGWLPKITKELCIFEDNSKDRNAEETLKGLFRKVEFVGLAHDQGDCKKRIIFCWK